ncbi:MAG: hypothetical protein R3C14_08800 [Caldilineaceae bacterium]
MSWDLVSGWDKVFKAAETEIAYKLEIASVTASGWAMGRSNKEIEDEAKRRLKERGITVPDKKT